MIKTSFIYPLHVGLVYAALLVIILIVYIMLGLFLTHSKDPNAIWVEQRGLNWGLVIAGFWLIEIVAGNLLDPKYSLVKPIYFGSSVAAFSLPFFAGIDGTRRTRFIRTGTVIGLWSGMVSGLLTFLCLMAVTYLFLNTLLQDPQNILQFKGSSAPDLVTFVIGDSLAGAIGHLIIGLILGPAFGTIGGLIGKAFAQPIAESTT